MQGVDVSASSLHLMKARERGGLALLLRAWHRISPVPVLPMGYQSDPRFFVLTNLGALDERFQPLVDQLKGLVGVFLLVPLMGGPHLVISVNTLQGQANIAFTYDPRVLTEAQVDAVFEGLDHAVAD